MSNRHWGKNVIKIEAEIDVGTTTEKVENSINPRAHSLERLTKEIKSSASLMRRKRIDKSG